MDKDKVHEDDYKGWTIRIYRIPTPEGEKFRGVFVINGEERTGSGDTNNKKDAIEMIQIHINNNVGEKTVEGK